MVADGNAVPKEEEEKTKGPQLSRKNSSKNLVSKYILLSNGKYVEHVHVNNCT